VPNTLTTFFTRRVKTYKLPRITLHELRHTFITALRMVGADIKDAQLAARHKHFSTTADHYTHEMDERQRAVMDRYDALIRGRSG
jgi:integrase